MLLQLTLAALAALSVAPCVLQRLCPSRPPRPPSSVCMHRVPTKSKESWNFIFSGSKISVRNSRNTRILPRQCPSPWAQQRAMPVHLAPAAALAALILIITTQHHHKANAECKNCIALDKEGQSLLRAQWEACGAGAVGAQDGAELKRRAYCALRRCKLLAKDGKLRKAALTHLARGLPADQAKILERCSKQTGDTPEDLAWNIFTCAFEHKSLLNLPPRVADAPGEDTSRLTD